jgi:hypothetical protein
MGVKGDSSANCQMAFSDYNLTLTGVKSKERIKRSD